ncbi:recombinase family protein [Dactylosporangium sp. NPDC005572]|uniref:recombinase family protein n=1 Tax=Dactylosporangium sp. NPDC005572 TaxID=3156889 RepID=UPI0033A30374
MTRHHDRPTTTRKRAFAYLRVSSAGQVNTDYDPEGISLPAQRAAVQRRAAELDAEIIAEFVEPGRSATTVDRRPEFQAMMARLKAERDVDYVIVYARSRLHRNSIDAAITKRDLRTAGATLISVMDYTEDSAIGDLVATVLDGVNEYQSRAAGADIAYKMGQKIINGGLVSKAPIGYLNVRERFEGREVRTVKVDPERGPLIRTAFELYATGDYGFHALIEALTNAGLRTRPTKRFPAGTPISINSLGNLLRDRFYRGFVSYKGQEYQGRHEPLVSEELFNEVQRMLERKRAGGIRERNHSHYLKGVVWCHRCQGRLMIMRGKSHTGSLYFYYFCQGRQRHTCDLPYLPIAKVETAVIDNYATVMLSSGLRERITTRVGEVLNHSETTRAEVQQRTRVQLAKLDVQEDRFLDLVGDPDWPQDKIAQRRSARSATNRPSYDANSATYRGPARRARHCKSCLTCSKIRRRCTARPPRRRGRPSTGRSSTASTWTPTGKGRSWRPMSCNRRSSPSPR